MSCQKQTKTFPAFTWQPLEGFYDDNFHRFPWAELILKFKQRRQHLISFGFYRPDGWGIEFPGETPDFSVYGTGSVIPGMLALDNPDNPLSVCVSLLNEIRRYISWITSTVNNSTSWMSKGECSPWALTYKNEIYSLLSQTNTIDVELRENWKVLFDTYREMIDLLAYWETEGTIPAEEQDIIREGSLSVDSREFFFDAPWPYVYRIPSNQTDDSTGLYSEYKYEDGKWYWKWAGAFPWYEMPITLDTSKMLYYWNDNKKYLIGYDYNEGTGVLTGRYFHFDSPNWSHIPGWQPGWVYDYYSLEGRTYQGIRYFSRGFDDAPSGCLLWTRPRYVKTGNPNPATQGYPPDVVPSPIGLPSFGGCNKATLKISHGSFCSPVKFSIRPIFDKSEAGPIVVSERWHGPYTVSEPGTIDLGSYTIALSTEINTSFAVDDPENPGEKIPNPALFGCVRLVGYEIKYHGSFCEYLRPDGQPDGLYGFEIT